MKEDLIRWNHQNLSLLGRIATIKMNILPQILYLFQTIPIVIRKQHFKHWKKEITNFIWAGKKPRVKYKILCDARERSGLQLPDLETYYDACYLVWVREWIKIQDKKMLALEGFNKNFGWHAYLMYGKEKVDAMFKHHYIRGSLLNTWLKYRKHLTDKRPMWIIPEEAIYSVVKRKERTDGI